MKKIIIKIIINLIPFLILFAGVFAFAYFNGFLDQFLPFQEEPADGDTTQDPPAFELVEAKEPVYVGSLDFDEEKFIEETFYFDKYEEFLKETNAAYLWEGELIPSSGEGFEHRVESISKDEFENRMKNYPLSEEDKLLFQPSYSADELKEKAKAIIENLTNPLRKVKRKNSNGFDFYVSYNGSSTIECFKDINIDAEGEDTFFFKNKLDLTCENVEVGSLLCGEDLMEGRLYIAVVSADVTCNQNSGTFKDLSWIPEEGETERITFLLRFGEINRMVEIALIHDIRVIS